MRTKKEEIIQKPDELQLIFRKKKKEEVVTEEATTDGE